jgi:hypothetical protein
MSTNAVLDKFENLIRQETRYCIQFVKKLPNSSYQNLRYWYEYMIIVGRLWHRWVSSHIGEESGRISTQLLREESGRINLHSRILESSSVYMPGTLVRKQ